MPVTSLKLEHKACNEIISTGFAALDNLFKDRGIFRGSSVLVSGSAGTAKTTIAAYFALGSCKRKERVLFFSFEESPEQLVRNMHHVGINLRPYIKSKLLIIHSSRPTLQGLEMHLLILHKLIEEFKPKTVIVDPISSLITIGSIHEVRVMLVRLLDMLKTNEINSMFTSLTHDQLSEYKDLTIEAVSSLADTWIKVRNEECDGERIRSLFIVKSRGAGHSNKLHDFIITDKGLELTDWKQIKNQQKKNKV